MGDHQSDVRDGLPQGAVGLLLEFIEEGHHYLPSGHLMTLHQANCAFTRTLKEATGKRSVRGGIAAALLRKLKPELHEQMRLQAVNGNRPHGWRTEAGAAT